MLLQLTPLVVSPKSTNCWLSMVGVLVSGAGGGGGALGDACSGKPDWPDSDSRDCSLQLGSNKTAPVA